MLYGVESVTGIWQIKYTFSDVIQQRQIQVFSMVCVPTEQMLERKFIFFACRHHVYELVLKSAYESKVDQVTSIPAYLFLKGLKISGKQLKSIIFKLQ